MELWIKAVAGALIVILIQFFSRTKNYFLAGLVPLFPTFTLISHSIVGSEHTTKELKQTILFGMLAIIPYIVYLLAMYFLVDHFKLATSILVATSLWIVSAAILIVVWNAL